MPTDTMRFKNESKTTVNLESIGLGFVDPDEEIDVPLVLCAPSRGDAGNRKPSPIETVAPQMKPSDPEHRKIWGQVPPASPAVSRIVSVNNQKGPSEPAGVKAIREAMAKKKADEAKSGPQTQAKKD